MITIDASQGEGGGQVLRTAISLSSITGKPVTLDGIRAGRKKPGLKRQHLTGVRAATAITNAKTTGAELNSQTLVFEPGPIQAGDYEVAVGTAGSCGLVVQTALPILLHADAPSSLRVSGGTHVHWSPTYDFLATSFMPQIAKMGVEAELELLGHGFFPAGGGSVRLTTQPWKTQRALELMTRGESRGVSAEIISAHIKPSVAQRELETLTRKLSSLKDSDTRVTEVSAPCGGNIANVKARFETIDHHHSQIGQRGVKSETVATRLADDVRRYLTGSACAGEYLADQLLLPCALAASEAHGSGLTSRFTATEVSLHTRTNIDIIRAFLRVDIRTHQTDRKVWEVTVSPS